MTKKEPTFGDFLADQRLGGKKAKQAFQHTKNLLDEAQDIKEGAGYTFFDADFIDPDNNHVKLLETRGLKPLHLGDRVRVEAGNKALKLLGKKPTINTSISATTTPLSGKEKTRVTLDHEPTSIIRSTPYEVRAYADDDPKSLGARVAAEHAERLMDLSIDHFQMTPDVLLSPRAETEWSLEMNHDAEVLFRGHGIELTGLKLNERAAATFKLSDHDYVVVDYEPSMQESDGSRRTPDITLRLIQPEEAHGLRYALSTKGVEIHVGTKKQRSDRIVFAVYEPNDEKPILIHDVGEIKSGLAILKYLSAHSEAATVEVREVIPDSEFDEERVKKVARSIAFMVQNPELALLDPEYENNHKEYIDREFRKITQEALTLPKEVDILGQLNRILRGDLG